MFEKIWSRHVVAEGPGGHPLLYVDRHLLHDGSPEAFRRLRACGRTVRRPRELVATADHYVPTGAGSEASANEEIQGMVEALARNSRELGITQFGRGDVRQGIVHVIGPEQGLTQPGIVLVCGDSHTATHGAFGALAFGIGSTEVEHVLATQCLWQRKPKVMRITVEGARPSGVAAKDVILAVIARIGAAGAVGHAIEYAGPVIRGMSMEERMTVCNMSIEAGARAGMIAPDETTFAYLEGRPYAPKGAHQERALALWKTVPSDADAVFDGEVSLDAAAIAPTVTWGTSPQDALPISAREPGCSMCIGMNADTARSGERVASTSNRNFEGRQGKGARTHLMSPAMAAAAAVTGRLTDVRSLYPSPPSGERAAVRAEPLASSGEARAE